jgi:antitoxin component of RelBE/YafQ-DinJ toxin-antitoxin module
MLELKTKEKKISTTFKLKAQQRKLVKEVVSKYGYSATDIHQMLEDYIAKTKELPLFLLNPKRKKPIDTINYEEYNTTGKTDETTSVPTYRAGFFLSQKHSDN